MATGVFISFEGIDGAGKSSHIAPLGEALQAAGRVVTQTREPGGTPLAERLRDLLLHEAMDPLAEALLMFAARRDHVLAVIEPALAAGKVVLCDRFTDASYAYQGAGRGFSAAVLAQLEQWVQAVPALPGAIRQPDLTLWFDLAPATAAARLRLARHADRFEAQEEAFFQRVAAGYGARAAAEPGRFVRIDAAVAPDQVWDQVHGAVTARGWLP